MGLGLYAVRIPHPSNPYKDKEGYRLVEVVSDDMKHYPRLDPTHTHTLNFSREIAQEQAYHSAVLDYEVDDIEKHKVVKEEGKPDKYWFWTRWKGFTRHWKTWEPAEQFLPMVNSAWRKYVLRHKLPVTLNEHLGSN